MDTIFSRTGDAAIPQSSTRQQTIVKRVLGLLSKVALAAAEKVTSPYRDVPPEYYRFPLF